jgi:hypothetical protein
MPVDALAKPWQARDSAAPLHLSMTFDGDALVLGAGTRLGIARPSLFLRKQDSETFDDARVAALLAVAHGRAIAAPKLVHIRKALERKTEGQTPLALVHLALAGLPNLDSDGEGAWRLSAADGLMKGGMAPATLLEALGLWPAANEPLDRAYNPDQPRVPAGNGTESGQWTSGDWAGDAAAETPPSAPDSSAGDSGNPGQDILIADSSPDWARYLNPISPAAATGGNVPNAQHQGGVDRAISFYQSLGYGIVSTTATAVDIAGFDSPRVYDFIVEDPTTGNLIGVEVKTTIGDTVFLNPYQVVKDAALMLQGGAIARVSGETISGVSYTALCANCQEVDIRGTLLYMALKFAGIPFIRGRFPGQRLP